MSEEERSSSYKLLLKAQYVPFYFNILWEQSPPHYDHTFSLVINAFVLGVCSFLRVSQNFLQQRKCNHVMHELSLERFINRDA